MQQSSSFSPSRAHSANIVLHSSLSGSGMHWDLPLPGVRALHVDFGQHYSSSSVPPQSEKALMHLSPSLEDSDCKRSRIISNLVTS